MLTEKQINLFWSNVDVKSKDECWGWKLGIDKYGYGKVNIGQKYYIAHRAAYEISNKEIDKTLCVLHSCDNPRCCNPNHLSQGTHIDNTRDKVSKGRAAHVSTYKKLTIEKAEEIRFLFSKGTSKLKLGRMFDLSPSSIRDVIHRRTWNY